MPTPTYDLIASNVLTSSASSVTFSSIPATYRDLVLVLDIKANSSSAFGVLQFNGDTGNNYNNVRMTGQPEGALSATTSNAAFLDSFIEASTGPTVTSWNTIQIMDYSATDKHKTALIRAGRSDGERVTAMAGRWASTSAINSILISAFSTNTYAAGSTFYLYGIVS